MPVDFSSRYIAYARAASKITAVFTAAVGALVLIGWWLNLEFLKTVLPEAASMKVNTALGFLFTGAALWLLQAGAPARRWMIARRVCISLVLLIGLLTLAEYAFGWQLGIDQLFVRDTATSVGVFPGRPAVMTVFNFCMVGLTLWLLDGPRRYRLAQALALASGLIALLAIVGYLYGAEEFYRLSGGYAMAPHTAVTFFVIALGLLLARPDKGWGVIFTSDSAGGLLARRLLPAAVVIPILLGWLRLLGQQAGWYDTQFGLALFATSNIIVFTTLIAASARSLFALDVARHAAEDRVKALNADLERRVLERTAQLTEANQRLAREAVEREQIAQEINHLKQALDQMDEGAQIIAPDWRYLYLNDAAARQGKRAVGDLLGHTMPEMYPGIEHSPLFAAMRRCLEQQAAEHMENEFSFPDGSTGWYDLSLQPMTSGLFILSTDITDRKRSEAALRESEARFAAAFRSSPAGLTITRQSDGQFVDVNETFLNLVGYTRAEAIGQRAADLGINTDPAQRAELLKQLAAQGFLHNFEVTLRSKDGGLRHMQLSADLFTLEGQAHILTTMIDITHRIQAEAALRDSEAKLRALFAALPVGITILDRDHHVVETNPALERILASSKDSLALGAAGGRHYIHPDGAAVQPEEFPSAAVFATQQAVLDQEMGLVLDTGQTIWTSVSAVPVPGDSLGALVVTSDITEHKQAEAALAQERDLLQTLLDHIPDTIYFKDAASRFTRINAAQARVLGISDPRLAYGKTDADFQAPDLAAGFLAEEQRLMETGQPIIDRQEFNPTPDGQPRWFSATKVPLIDRQGRAQGLIGISHDITQRIQAAEGLSQAIAALTERVRQMAVLHELDEQLQACFTPAEVYQVTAHQVSQLFPAVCGGLYRLTPGSPWFERAAAWGKTPPEAAGFAPDDCWAVRRGRVYQSGTAYPTHLVCQHLSADQPALAICIPILAQGETLGLLQLRSAPGSTAPTWDEGLLQLTRVVADSVALALANLSLREKLREQSIRDPLTNLYNRRYMEESLERELLLATRRDRPVGVIMLDLDHFKQINDLHGHGVGDAVLRQLGSYLSANTRGGDIACRYGGEEFTLILPEADLEQTRQRAEQHCEAFKNLARPYTTGPLAGLTISCGVAAYPASGQTAESLLRAADVALYRAKHEGRDRVAVAE